MGSEIRGVRHTRTRVVSVSRVLRKSGTGMPAREAVRAPVIYTMDRGAGLATRSATVIVTIAIKRISRPEC